MTAITSCDTYDLFHVGHLKLSQQARELSGPDRTLMVVVSSDKFNCEQKGERCAISDYQRTEIDFLSKSGSGAIVFESLSRSIAMVGCL